MRVLLTGITSFTGSHFARALIDRGIEVWATQRIAITERNDPMIDARLKPVIDKLHLIPAGSLGSASTLATINDGPAFDALCLHGAETNAHQSQDFDWRAALDTNTMSMDRILDTLHAHGCRSLLITGSIFEASDLHPAVSPYGLSKTLTNQTWRFAASARGWRSGQFIIPHPFGEFEKPGLISHVMQSWLNHRTPALNQPELIRDFIPVPILARAYANLLVQPERISGDFVFKPSGLVFSNAQFIERMASHVQAYLDWECGFCVATQPVKSVEPVSLINSNRLDLFSRNEDENSFWQDFIRFHQWAKSLSIYG